MEANEKKKTEELYKTMYAETDNGSAKKSVGEMYETMYADEGNESQQQTRLYETMYADGENTDSYSANAVETEDASVGISFPDQGFVQNAQPLEYDYQRSSNGSYDTNGYYAYDQGSNNGYDENAYNAQPTQASGAQYQYNQTPPVEHYGRPVEKKEGSKAAMIAALIFSFVVIVLLLLTILWMFVFRKSDNKKDRQTTTSQSVSQQVTEPVSQETNEAKETVAKTTAPTTRTTTTLIKSFVEPTDQWYIRTMTVKTNGDKLRMRSGPGYQYSIIGEIPNKTSLDVLSEEYDPDRGEMFAYVNYNGKLGWVTEAWMTEAAAVTTTKKKTTTTTPTTQAKVTNKKYNSADVISDLEEHYNSLYDDDGNYVIFDSEYEDDGYTITAILRYQMTDEEAEDRRNAGKEEMANVYVAKIIIDKETGQVTSDFKESDWYIW